MLWYIVATNLFFCVPARHLAKLQHWDDLILTCSTGIASFLYHGNWISNYKAIRNVDIILADLLVVHTAHSLLNFQCRWTMSVGALPLVIYTAEIDVLYRFIGMIGWGLVTMLYVATHHKQYHMRWALGGAGLILGELACFALGNRGNYDWFHGTHHILAFMAQWCFLRSLNYQPIAAENSVV